METNERKRVYPSQQLTVALDAKTLKVLLWICGWGASVKYYPKQFAKACKMEEEDVELQIQTLIDAHLVDVSKVDNVWILSPNGKTFQKYYEIPLSKVLEGNGIPIASTITWNCEASKQDVADMTEQEIRTMILRLQASLNEKQQLKKLIASSEPKEINDLPF